MIILSEDKKDVKCDETCGCSDKKNLELRDIEIKNQSGFADSNNKVCDCNKLNKED